MSVVLSFCLIVLSFKAVATRSAFDVILERSEASSFVALVRDENVQESESLQIPKRTSFNALSQKDSRLNLSQSATNSKSIHKLKTRKAPRNQSNALLDSRSDYFSMIVQGHAKKLIEEPFSNAKASEDPIIKSLVTSAHKESTSFQQETSILSMFKQSEGEGQTSVPSTKEEIAIEGTPKIEKHEEGKNTTHMTSAATPTPVYRVSTEPSTSVEAPIPVYTASVETPIASPTRLETDPFIESPESSISYSDQPTECEPSLSAVALEPLEALSSTHVGSTLGSALILEPIDAYVATTPEDILAYLEMKGIDTAEFEVNVVTPEAKIGIVVTGARVELENVKIQFLDDFDILIQSKQSQLRLKHVEIEIQPPTIRSALRSIQSSSSATGIDIRDGSEAIIETSVFKFATNTAVMVQNLSSLTCSESTFSYNRGINGGAIRIVNSNAHFRGGSFDDNSGNFGGAIYFEANDPTFDSILEINSVSFQRNKAFNQGGSIFINKANVVNMINSHFINNSAENDGGSLYIDRAEIVSITDTTFDRSQTKNYKGGGVFITNGKIFTLVRTVFDENLAPDGAGLALFRTCSQSSKVIIQEGQFTNNIASSRGGGLFIHSKIPCLTSTINTVDLVDISINETIFIHNSADKGGAVFVSSKSKNDFDIWLSIEKSNFNQNAAIQGGGVYCGSNSSVDINHSQFEDNDAITGNDCITQCECQV